MLNYNPELTGIDGQLDDYQIRTNQRIVEQHLDDVYLVRTLSPGVFVPFAGSAHGTAGQSAGVGKWPTVDYPDGVVSYATTSFWRPAYWLDGNLKVTILYTSQTAGVAVFSLAVSIGAVPALGNMSNTGVTAIQAVVVDVPGPTVADDEKEYVFFTSTARLDQRFRRVYVRVGRNQPDANASVMQLVDVKLEFIPVR